MKTEIFFKWHLDQDEVPAIEEFCRLCEKMHIFQALAWLRVNDSNRKYVHLYITKNRKIVCFALIETIKVPFLKKYIGSIKCGPVFNDITVFRENFQLIIQELKKNKFMAFDLNPFWINQGANEIERIIIENKGKCAQTPIDYHYMSVHIDLTQKKKDIYSSFKSSLKRQIKKSKKIPGILIRDGTENDCVMFAEMFNTMMKKQGKRQKIDPLYIKKIFHNIIKKGLGYFLIQEYLNNPVAAVIALQCGHTLVYTHGTSVLNYKEIPKAHLLHWELIKRAKSQKLRFYDLGGIVLGADKKKDPVLYGITRFKFGYSKTLVTTCRKHLIILQKNIYYFIQLILKISLAVKHLK